jgi:hypothetical protein
MSAAPAAAVQTVAHLHQPPQLHPAGRPLADDLARRRARPLADRITVVRAVEVPGPPNEQPTTGPTANDPDPRAIATIVAPAVVEVVLGSRPVSQLARWLTIGVLAQLRERARLTSPACDELPRLTPVVRRLIVCRLHNAVEVAAAVDDSHRTRAVALRLERQRGAWRVTALEVG